jgi:hypothetical protein
VYPALQVQALREVEPSGEPALFGQLVHCPDQSLYWPEGHVDVATEHGPPLLPVYPVLQVQALREVLPRGELELLGQLLHCPDEALYWPEGHVDVATEHGPPLLPVYPVLQVQVPMEVLP